MSSFSNRVPRQMFFVCRKQTFMSDADTTQRQETSPTTKCHPKSTLAFALLLFCFYSLPPACITQAVSLDIKKARDMRNQTQQNCKIYTQQTWFCCLASSLLLALHHCEEAVPTMSHHFSSVHNHPDMRCSNSSSVNVSKFRQNISHFFF